MNLRLELPNPDKKLKPEMFATIRVYSEPEPNVLVVAEAAVQRDRERKFVFVQREPSVFEAREVKLGDSNGREVKVLDGLREGESVVTKGAFVLKSELLGEQVQPDARFHSVEFFSPSACSRRRADLPVLAPEASMPFGPSRSMPFPM